MAMQFMRVAGDGTGEVLQVFDAGEDATAGPPGAPAG
jgi:hypothetical protein